MIANGLETRPGTVIGLATAGHRVEIAFAASEARPPVQAHVEGALIDVVELVRQVAPCLVVVLIDDEASIGLAARLAAARLPVALILDHHLDHDTAPRAVAAARLGRTLRPRRVSDETARQLARHTSISLSDAARAFGVARWPMSDFSK